MSTTAFDDDSWRLANLALHVSGLALLFVSAGILLSAIIEAGAGGPEVASLTLAAATVGAAGAGLWRFTRVPRRVSAGNTFLAVVAAWVASAIGGAIPFVYADTFVHLDDALFESVSGFTGTGSSVLVPIEGTPRGLLFWRSMTQFYGGMGMVVLAVTVLPFLGVGGMQLLRAEAPGPSSDRLAPRVSETAKRLWYVYVGYAVVSALVLLAVGMSLFDAVTHSFTVVSTGGLSTHDASIGFFDSVAVEAALIVLMLFGATNFTLHWRAVRGDIGAYHRSSMFRWFMSVFVIATVTLVTILVADGMALPDAIRDGAFNVTTLLTSTGFGTADFVQWTPAAQLLLLALMFSGGMAGSTSGGMKLIRVRVMLNQALREFRRVRHPRAVFPLKIGGGAVGGDILASVAAFAMLYVLSIIASTIALTLLGTDLITSAGASASALGNMGPGLGDAGPASNYLVFSRPARGVIMVGMLTGRLEMFPIVVSVVRLVTVLSPGRLRPLSTEPRRRVDQPA
ncbi:MAG: TrkH family potassium uptake protein [Acidimicrobiia bacterium]|nr:TrkH family potassium uptake protein [Acidimicrobiia bacterium]